MLSALSLWSLLRTVGDISFLTASSRAEDEDWPIDFWMARDVLYWLSSHVLFISSAHDESFFSFLTWGTFEFTFLLLLSTLELLRSFFTGLFGGVFGGGGVCILKASILVCRFFSVSSLTALFRA